ncbi:MAG: response regulator [Desulfobacteraceae bacterium]
MQGSPRVLIVDDEPRMCQSLSMLLSKNDYDIRTANSGSEAMGWMSKEAFDAAILDIMLPDMSGHQLMEYLKERFPEIYVIMITGNASLDSALQALRQGAFDYLKKPFEFAQLVNTLQNALSQKQLREENIAMNGKLAVSEERYEYLVKHSPDIIYMLDSEGNFTFISDAVEHLLGYKPEELVGRHFSSIVVEEDLESCRWFFQERRTGERAASGVELRLKAKQGKASESWGDHLTVELKSTGMYERRGGNGACVFLGTHGVVRDISRRKRLEAQLQHVERMEALGTLAGGIAHNFNNILMGIQGNASLMLLDKDPADSDYRRLENIIEYVQSGSDLTRQLLGFARGGKYEVRPIDMNGLVERTAEMFGRTRKDIRIIRDLREDLWSVEADERQLEQVLLNLYVNAWQAMPEGGEIFLTTSHLSVIPESPLSRELSPGDYVVISIRDTGMGIDESIRSRIFEPFFTTKEVGKGTGLGLASAFGIVKKHGGTIRVESRLGQGTTFNVYLPASGAEVPTEEKTKTKELIKGSGTVLLVDDEAMILEVGTDLLKRLGYNVVTASSGPEAVDVFRERADEVDLVILDLVMPDMDGGKVYEALREIDPEVKALLASGHGLEGRATEVLEAGCDGFLQKPFNLDELSRKIGEVMAGRSDAS